MKKTLSILLLGLVIAFNPIKSQAQESKHEISVGYGFVTTNDILDLMSDIIITDVTVGTVSSNTSFSGCLNVSYKYRLTKRFGLGFSFMYETSTADGMVLKKKVGQFKNKYYSIAAEADFRYINSKYFTLYGLLGAGGTIYQQKYVADGEKNKSYKQFNFNFQVTPIAFKLGNHFGIFGELGLGYKGIGAVGIFARF